MYKLLRSSVTTFLLLLAVSAAFLFVIKHKVQLIDKQLQVVNNQIMQEQENIHILNAEYSYLASPKRIKSIVKDKMSLQTVKASQIYEEVDIPKLMVAAKRRNGRVD